MVAARRVQDVRVVVNRPVDECEGGQPCSSHGESNVCTDRPHNLGFIHANLLAGDLQSILYDITAAGAHIHCVAVQFPDPHWKGKNRKRRMLTPSLLRTAGVYLMPGGMFYLQSDVRDVVVDTKRDVQSQANNLLVLYSNVVTSLPDDTPLPARVSSVRVPGASQQSNFQVVQVFGEDDESVDGFAVDDIAVEDVASEENLVEEAIAAAVAESQAADLDVDADASKALPGPPLDPDPDSPSYRIVRVYSNEDESQDDIGFDDVDIGEVVPENGSIDGDCEGTSMATGLPAGSPSYSVIKVFDRNEDEAPEEVCVDEIKAEDVVSQELIIENPLGCNVCSFDHDADNEATEDSGFLLSMFADSNTDGSGQHCSSSFAGSNCGNLLDHSVLLAMQKIDHVDDISAYVPKCFTEVQTERCLYVTRKNKSVHHLVLRMNDVALSKRSVISDIKSQTIL